MSTSNTHQQSLADVGSETRPPMLERGSYIPWASRFRRYLNRKRENRKWLNKAIDEGLYEFKNYTPIDCQTPRMQTEEVLTGDDLKHYEAEIEVMNLILISISNVIYNSVDACTTAKAIWERSNEVGKSHDPLVLVAHTGSSSRTTSPYYVTHPSSVVDYDDYQGDALQNNIEDPLTYAMILLARAITQCFSNPTNNRLRTSSKTRNQAIIQANRVHIQSKNSGNDGRNTRCLYVQEEIIKGNNGQNDAGNIQRTLRTTSSGTTTNVQCYNYSEKGPSYDSAFLSEVQTPSTSYVNPLFAKEIKSKNVNSGSVEHDNNVQASYALEQLALNAYKEAEKQQINANKLKQQNKELTQQLDLYKEKNPKLYDASCFTNTKIHVNVKDIEDILDDATKSQTKMENKLKDPVAIEEKQNIRTIDYNKLNALYEDFVSQKELSAEQKYFSSTFIPSENHSNASTSTLPSETKPFVPSMPSPNPMKLYLEKMENDLQHCFL
ncbi:hypothetical protein Tco_1245982 [Tanacetum coccineum]